MADDGGDVPRLAKANPRLTRIRRLARSRRERDETGRFVIEGPALVVEAADAGLDLEMVVVPEGAPALETTAPVHCVDPSVFEQLTTTASPQPALAVAARPRRPVDYSRGLVLVLAAVADPGNVGTLVRAAEAAGAVAAVAVAGTADPFSPKAVRASAGSVFRLPVEVAEIADLEADAAAAGAALVATVADGGSPHHTADLTGPLALVVGNEAHGVPAELATDRTVTVTMAPGPESLNAAMAGTVVLFEALRQRIVRGDRPPFA